MNNRTILRHIFDKFLDSLVMVDKPEDFELTERVQKVPEKNKILPETLVDRSTSFGRIYEQLYQQLYEQDTWAYPNDVYVGDDGKSLFAIVSQSGKLFQIPLSIDQDNVLMGEWVQVKEEYTPVEQSFRVFRQKDGKYRWTCIAATSILNRVNEIDSTDLFDSFIERAEATGEYPRLDFYHLGRSNPEMWDFGTADYLAREGVCYIASGTFDEDHPLAKATIRACEENPGIWGNSIEFYSLAEAEVIIADPQVRIPVYRKGKNTRISVVLEEDAAGLFTRIDVAGEVERTMDQKTLDKLSTLYGDDTEGLNAFLRQFEENVDGVNRTVKEDNLIHRAKDEESQSESKQEDNGEDGQKDNEIVLDEEALNEIVTQVAQSETFRSMASGIDEIKELVSQLVVERENDKKEISRLNQEIERLSKDEDEKKTEYLQDLPTRRRTHITHRPRSMEDPNATASDMKTIADRTMGKVPAANRY